MGTFPTEIYGIIGDFLVDIRPILLSCREIYRELYGRADAEFWRLREELDRARIVPSKMFECCEKMSFYKIIQSGNVELLQYRGWSFRWFYVDSAVRSRSRRMFDYVMSLAGPVISERTDLSTCIKFDDLYMLKAILSKSYPGRFNDDQIIYTAAQEGATDVLRWCIPRYDNDKINAALRAAVKSGKIDAVKMLVDAGGNVHVGNLLRTAIYHGHHDVAIYLTEVGARDDIIREIVQKFPNFYAAKSEFVRSGIQK